MQSLRAHCSTEFDYSTERPHLRFADGGRLLKLSFARSQSREWNDEMFVQPRGGARGKCRGFSSGSRRRMLENLNSVSVAAKQPYFVTMTLPDEVYLQNVAEFSKTAKHWRDSFTKRLLRVEPEAAGFWRIEWKPRESGAHVGQLFPHFHLLVWGLPEREISPEFFDGACVRDARYEAYVRCRDNQLTLELLNTWSERGRQEELKRGDHRCATSQGYTFTGSPRFIARALNLSDAVACETAMRERMGMCSVESTPEQVDACSVWAARARNMSFQDWASIAWYHIVDSHNVDHAQAGVRVERVHTWGGVLSYCSKYLAKEDSAWMAEIEWGRSWGVFNREHVPWAKMLDIELDNEVGVRLRRVARHYLERRCKRRVMAPYGITLYCDVAQFRCLWEVPRDPF